MRREVHGQVVDDAPWPRSRVALIADHPVQITVTGSRLSSAEQSLFGAFPTTEAAPAAEIVVGGEPGTLPSGPPLESVGRLHLWRDEDVLWIDAGFDVRARCDHRGAVIGGGTPAAYLSALRRMIQPLLTHLLGLAAKPALHAAAVATDAGAVLILGTTGRGKSTTAYAAVRAGWRLLSDDLVVVYPDLTVMGVHREPHVPPDVALDGAPVADDQRHRLTPSLDLDAGRYPIRCVVRVDHSALPGGEIRPLEAVRLAQLAFAAFPVNHPRFAQLALDRAGDLAMLPGMELLLPADPARRLEFVGDVLSAQRF